MGHFVIEVCCGSVFSARVAQDNGAGRLELCSSLQLGGYTPNPGLISVVKSVVSIPVNTMVRFIADRDCFSEDEVLVMERDVHHMVAAGADGIVFGARTADGLVDEIVCRRLIKAANGLPVTYHRSFDQIVDQNRALETLIELGFSRVLTSGGANTVPEGLEQLAKLIDQAEDRIIILPGGGVRVSAMAGIVSRLDISEIHGTFRAVGAPAAADTDPEQLRMAADAIRRMRENAPGDSNSQKRDDT